MLQAGDAPGALCALAVDKELPGFEVLSDEGFPPRAVRDPSGHDAAAAEDRRLVEVGLIDDVEAVFAGIGSVESKGLLKLVSAATQIDHDVGPHGLVDLPHG